MKRQIIELDDMLLIDAEVVAKQQDTTLDEVMAAALREYIAAHRQPNRLSFIGMFEGPDDAGSDPEEIDHVLREGIDRYEGWSPDKPKRRPVERHEASS